MSRRIRRGLCASVVAALGLAGVSVGAGAARASGCGGSEAPLQNLPGCNLNRATLGASLALADSDLQGSNLNMAHISGQGALLGSNLADANLNHAVITGPDALVDANLSHVNLNAAQISGIAVGAGADATGANLDHALIGGLADFLSAHLTGANLHRAAVDGVGALTGADVSRTHLEGATISGKTALFEANLTGANLEHDAISGTGALSGANLTGADLRGAHVTGTGALADAPTQQTVYSDTICPDGTNSDADGGTCAHNLTLPDTSRATGVPSSPPDGPHAARLSPALISHAGVVTGSCPDPASPGPATQLVFLDPPPNIISTETAGTSFLVSVVEEDANGCKKIDDSSTLVALALGTNPSGAALTCTPTTGTPPAPNTGTISGGEVQFNCTIDTADTGYTLSATSNTNPALTGNSVAFNVAAAPPPPPPGTIVSSGGGLDLDGYCQSIGQAASHVPGVGLAMAFGGSNAEFGPNYAFDWYCVNPAGTSGSPIDMQAACNWEYGPTTVAFVQNPNDAYSWQCIATAGPVVFQVNTSPSTYLATDSSGGTYLADGGLGGASGLPDFVYLGPDGTLVADGGFGGGGSLPDIINSSPGSSSSGPTVTDSTPTGGFQVAESGSLATGGAI